MPTSAAIAKILIDNLFSKWNTTPCGPEHKFTAYHPNVAYLPDVLDNLPFITPDVAFRPKIMVVFDFMHQFTAQAETVSGIQGARPVSRSTLFRVAGELNRFFNYYFEYVLSYGKNMKGVSLRKQYGLGDLRNENEMNYFLNVIINFFLMSVNTDQNVGDIGTCNIALSNNTNYRFGQKLSIFFDQTFNILNQLFVPMIPVMAWGKGRLYKDWWFPIFDGYIISPNKTTSGGFDELTLDCKDTLEIARISTEMVNPSILQVEEMVKQNHINIFNQPFYGLDHMEIFKTMFHGGKLIYDPAKQRLVPSDPEFHKTEAANFSALGNFEEISDEDPTKTHPVKISDEKTAIHKDEFGMSRALRECSHETRPRNTVNWGNSFTPYRLYNTSSPDVFTAEFASRLDILQGVAQTVYYELYVDGYGHVQYHPMRLANKFLLYDIITSDGQHPNPFPGTQIIGPGETLNDSSRVNVEELVTFLRLTGKNPYVSAASPELLDIVGSANDEFLQARFGYRRRSVSNPLFNYKTEIPGRNGKKASFMDLVAKSLMQYLNSELYTTQRSLIFRPELRMAMPVYFPYEKNVFYCRSMSHSISINGDASTSINAHFGRKHHEMPPDLQSFLLMSEKIYKLDNKLPAFVEGLETIQQYYETAFSINEIPFVEWIDDLNKQSETFRGYQEAKSKERADLPQEPLGIEEPF